MIVEELFEKYPKAAKVIVEHFTKIFMDSLNNNEITDDFKEIAKTEMLNSEYIQTFIQSNPRGLFDVFDENNINIIIHVYTEEPPTEFAFSIAQHDYDHDELYLTRKEAEVAAVEQAFEILNDKL